MYTNDEALAWVERAEKAMAGFVSADDEERKSFAIRLLDDHQQQRPERAETNYPARKH